MINDTNGEYKMVLVIRNDLKMGKGKVAAQCAHAAVAGYAAAMKMPKYLQAWEESGHKKITLKVYLNFLIRVNQLLSKQFYFDSCRLIVLKNWIKLKKKLRKKV